jgi:ABC-type phosphate/phosphonate transport system substrate-binding protein
MKKQAILILFAVAIAAMLAGCAASSSYDANTAGANAAISSAGQTGAKPQEATPYSQPLMATGGDLVMLRVTSTGIAG